VRAILAMTGELGLEVVAEGIETNSQLLLLQEMGCSYGQGYGIAPPMPAPNVIGWVRSFTQ